MQSAHVAALKLPVQTAIMEKIPLRRFVIAVAAGTVAGLVGSLALSGTEAIEKQTIGREHGHVGADFAEKATGVRHESKQELLLLDQAVHYSYGAAWGALRGAMGAFGIGGVPGFLLHWLGVDVAAKLFLPFFGLAPTVDKRRPRNLLIDTAHHGIYCLVVGLLLGQMKKMGHSKS